MRTPVVLLTGIDRDAMTSAMVGLQFDLPYAVAVQHRIDVERQVLERVVSDVTGIIEHEEIQLEHACVTCAVREDVVPTLARLAADGRWASIVAHLPLAAEAAQVCGVLAVDTRLARRLRVTSVVAVLDGSSVVDDLLGDDLVGDRWLATSEADTRGVAEVGSALVEYADVVVLTRTEDRAVDPVGHDLVTALARPGAHVVSGCDVLDGRLLIGRLHDHATTMGWAGDVRSRDVPAVCSTLVWQLDLCSRRGFHPERLLDDLESLGSGRHRSRGYFWLPTRPSSALAWDGAGGQLSIGVAGTWGRRTPGTRLVLTGVGTPPSRLRTSFDGLLLSERDAASARWQVDNDGFEPWLGPIVGAA